MSDSKAEENTTGDAVVPEQPDTTADPEIKAFSLEILREITIAQLQNGLRQQHYQRYRSYCSRRLRRLRISLKLKHGKKFQKKEITPDSVKSARYYMIPLFQSERAWSHAMELKEELSAENTRVRYHLIRRLAKAAQWSLKLKELCAATADSRTALEADAYCCWTSANLRLEKEQWDKALDELARARTIYTQLSTVADAELQEMIKKKIEDIDASITFSTYNRDGETGTDISKLLELSGNDLLKAKLEEVLSETRKKQAETLKEVKWRGKTVLIRSEKLRVALINAQEAAYEVDRAKEDQTKLQLFTKLFMYHGETMDLIKKEANLLTAKEKRSAKEESLIEELKFLQQYVQYMKTTRTIERNLILVAEKQQFTRNGSVRKPDELVALYDRLLQNMSELEELRQQSDVEAAKEISYRAMSFKAYRCFYMALSYKNNKKWAEAIVLLDRCSKHATTASENLKSCSRISEADSQNLQKLTKLILSEKYIVTALANQEMESASSTSNSQKSEENVGKTLASSANVYDAKFIKTKKLIEVPPEFCPAPCKPLLFDLALSSCEFPSLEHRNKKSGGWFNFWS